MSLERDKRFEPITIVGLLITLLLHGGAVAGVIMYRRALEAAEVLPPPPSYVVAKLVRLGKPRDPRRMPDKIVPQEATRKDDGVDYTADASDAPSKKKPDDPKTALGDKLRRSLDKAELLAQAQSEVEAEGSPDGVPGGTANRASEGDAYMTKIADLWQRHWALPAIIPVDEARKLYVLVVLRLDQEGKIQFPIQFDRRSGNAHFDSSIGAAWQSIQKLPLPPPDRFAAILANGLALKITWRGME